MNHIGGGGGKDEFVVHRSVLSEIGSQFIDVHQTCVRDCAMIREESVTLDNLISAYRS